jgi:hypothetical protein
VSKTELFSIPEIKDQASFRVSEQDKKNLRLLMADRRVTSVSDILRWCLAEQAEPVRQRWLEVAVRVAAYDDDVAPDPAQDPDLSPEQ